MSIFDTSIYIVKYSPLKPGKKNHAIYYGKFSSIQDVQQLRDRNNFVKLMFYGILPEGKNKAVFLIIYSIIQFKYYQTTDFLSAYTDAETNGYPTWGELKF